MTEKEKTLDLATLEWIKVKFQLFSDHSCQTHGYRSLCRIIDELKNAPKITDIKSRLNPPDLNIVPITMPPRIFGSNLGCPLCNGSGQYKIGNFGGTAVEYVRCPCQDRVE